MNQSLVYNKLNKIYIKSYWVMNCIIYFVALNFLMQQIFTQSQQSQSFQLIDQTFSILDAHVNNNASIWLHLVKNQNQLKILRSQINQNSSLKQTQQIKYFNDQQTYQLQMIKIIAHQQYQMKCFIVLAKVKDILSYYFWDGIYFSFQRTDFPVNISSDTFEFEPDCYSFKLNNKIYRYDLQLIQDLSQQIILQIEKDFNFAISSNKIYSRGYLDDMFHQVYKIDFEGYNEIDFFYNEQSSLELNYDHFVIYGVKKELIINNYMRYSYKVQMISRINSQQFSLLEQIIGQSYLVKPKIYCDETVTKLIIDQTNKDSTHNYFGRFLEFSRLLTYQMKIPDQISKDRQNLFYLTQKYWYVRALDKSNSTWNGLFLFSSMNVLYIQQSYSSDKQNWSLSYLNQNNKLNLYNFNKKSILRKITTMISQDNYFLYENINANPQQYQKIEPNIVIQKVKYNYESFLGYARGGQLFLYKDQDNLHYLLHYQIRLSRQKVNLVIDKPFKSTLFYQNDSQINNCISILAQDQKGKKEVDIFYFDDINKRIIQYQLNNLTLDSSRKFSIKLMQSCQFIIINREIVYKRQNSSYKQILQQIQHNVSDYQTDKSFYFYLYQQLFYFYNQTEQKHSPQKVIDTTKNTQIKFNDQNILYSDQKLKKIIVLSRNSSIKLTNISIIFKNQKNMFQGITVVENLPSLNTRIQQDRIDLIKISYNKDFTIITVLNVTSLTIKAFFVDLKSNTIQTILIQEPPNLQAKDEYIFHNTNKYFYILNKYTEKIYKLQQSTDQSQNSKTKVKKFVPFFQTVLAQKIVDYFKIFSLLTQTEDHVLTAIYSKILIFQKFPYRLLFKRQFYSSINYLNQNISNLQRSVYYYKSDQNILTVSLCAQNCQYCLNYRLCLKCFPGYALKQFDSNCTKCGLNCKDCSKLNPSECLVCFQGFYLIDYKCRKCHPKCYQCKQQSQFSCTSCNKGDFLINYRPNNNTCLSCPQNCEICKNQTSCIQCRYGYGGYGIQNKMCKKCPLNCNNCTFNENYMNTCSSCRDTFYLQKQNKICLKCSQNCKICSSKDVCVKCNVGYFINQMKLCSIKCDLPCFTCDSTNSTKCKSCIENYDLDDISGNCVPNLKCNKNKECKLCPFNYRLVYGLCYTCELNDFCSSCDRKNPTKCTECIKGYYLSDEECIQCSPQCQSCYLGSICKQCKTGYMPMSDKMSYNTQMQYFKCIPCHQNCRTCIYSISNCLSCQQNYLLNGSTCVWSRQVAFKLKLDLDSLTITISLIDEVQSRIASIFNKSLSQIEFISITKGSVVFDGLISAKDKEDQLNILRNTKKITQTSSIGGMVVQSSEFSTNVTDDTANLTTLNSDRSIGLILGVTISLGLIFVFVIVFGVYYHFRSKKKAAASSHEYFDDSNFSAVQRDLRRQNRQKKKRVHNLPEINHNYEQVYIPKLNEQFTIYGSKILKKAGIQQKQQQKNQNQVQRNTQIKLKTLSTFLEENEEQRNSERQLN